ncbi:hypothetical protein ABPG75_003271 [Micractinium tetrahymenae]
MSAQRLTALLVLALLLGGAAAAGRSLAQDAGPKPPECSGLFTEQWNHDEIECHIGVCDGNPQLKCEHSIGVIKDERVSCELDRSIVSPAITFECPASGGKVMCDWPAVLAKIPGCAAEPVQRIMTSWRAS